MIAITLLTTLAASSLLARAAPSDANIALARRYAPQLRFEKGEKYWTSSVDYFLQGPLNVKDDSGNPVSIGGPLTTSNLNTLPNSGSKVWLTTDTSDAALGGFLAGQNPSTNNGGKVYTFVAPKDNGVVDLYYWIFNPFNLGKTVPLLGQVGNHVGDWERLKVRTANGTAVSVEYHAHGDTGSGTIPWDKVLKFDNDQRPIGYVASGSHGFWSTPGTFTYVNAVVFKLNDVTSDGGVSWDTKDALAVYNYPDTYTGDASWLNFQGLYGNKGETSCWWHFIYSECKLVDAPNGPLRGDVLGAAKLVAGAPTTLMDRPSTHALASVSTTGASRYTLYLKGATPAYVSVRQQCTVESDGNASHFVRHLEQQTDGSFAKRAEPKTSFVYGSAPFAATAVVSVAACPAGSAVTSYTVGACTSASADSCTFKTDRAIRAYSKDKTVSSVQAAQAIEIQDLDSWVL